MFKEWLITEWKYFTPIAGICGHCSSRLWRLEMSINPNHVYHIGTKYFCNCEKSSLWANSVRNPKNLIEFLDGKSERYFNGFCNDEFCGFCYERVNPVQNGVRLPQFPDIGFDRYGCESRQHNQDILVDGERKDPEGTPPRLMEYYKNNLLQLKKLYNEI